jgi:hypothetical protein
MERGLHKKLTYEDRFARKFYCNPHRFVASMKRANRRLMRKKLKTEHEGYLNNKSSNLS